MGTREFPNGFFALPALVDHHTSRHPNGRHDLPDDRPPIASRHKLSLTQPVIAWTLSQRGCSHVLCGARNPQQAVDNAGAGSVELSELGLAKITQAVHSNDGV
jgi:aryl-alcohol dehydrogenase-like predicted oxidoreductase